MLLIDSSCTVAVDAADPRALGDVRALIRRHLASESAWADVTDTALLLACELVGNVHRHCADGHCLLRMWCGGRLRIEVHDRSPRIPRPGRAGLYDQGGRGLALVDALAHSWGADPLPGGKRVWFELDR